MVVAAEWEKCPFTVEKERQKETLFLTNNSPDRPYLPHGAESHIALGGVGSAWTTNVDYMTSDTG